MKTGIIHKHKIVPFRLPRRAKFMPLNPELSKKVKEVILNWQKQGIIRESIVSPYTSARVVVGKKDGGIRLCVDFRALNEFTEKDAYPQVHIESSLSNLCKQKYFATLDCRTAYFSVPLDEESIPKTAIATQHGMFEFLRLPMGLTNACSVWLKVIHKILSSYFP